MKLVRKLIKFSKFRHLLAKFNFGLFHLAKEIEQNDANSIY